MMFFLWLDSSCNPIAEFTCFGWCLYNYKYSAVLPFALTAKVKLKLFLIIIVLAGILETFLVGFFCIKKCWSGEPLSAVQYSHKHFWRCVVYIYIFFNLCQGLQWCAIFSSLVAFVLMAVKEQHQVCWCTEVKSVCIPAGCVMIYKRMYMCTSTCLRPFLIYRKVASRFGNFAKAFLRRRYFASLVLRSGRSDHTVRLTGSSVYDAIGLSAIVFKETRVGTQKNWKRKEKLGMR